jgi:hypothetical protein
MRLHKKRSQLRKSSSTSTSAIYPQQDMSLAELESRQAELEASDATYKYPEADSRSLDRPIYEIGDSNEHPAELPGNDVSRRKLT